MFKETKLSRAVGSAIAVSLAGGAVVAHAEIEEIIVTAQKRAASLQDTPIAVQAMEEQSLDEQRIDTFADYIKLLPNAAAGGRGPGQNEIYIRGTAVDAINISVAEAQGSAPNVALYLDEQPVTAGGRNLDVYATDISRIEVLPGPQGTLYGASSQAGTVRLITNKPNLDAVEARLNATTSATTEGEPSAALEGVLNVPLTDRAAVRLAMFSDNQGGYIDNVYSQLWPDPAKNPRLPSRDGIMFVPAGGDPEGHEFADGTFAVPGRTYPVRYQPADNNHLVEEDFNDATYRGFRASGAFNLSDDWTLNVAHHQQTLTAEGVFDYDQEVGDLLVTRFTEDSLEDAFGQTSWTLEGRLGALNAIYTGAYLEREVEHSYDYSEYVNIGGYIPGYICEYNTPGYHGGGGVGYSHDPTLSGDPGVIECAPGDGVFLGFTDFDRTNHEFRIQSGLGQRISFTGGVFYQHRETLHTGNFQYGIDGGNPINPALVSRGRARSTAVRSPKVQFTNDIVRPEEELAFFGELSVNITDNLAATVGARQYTLETGFEGFSAFRYGNRPVPNLAGEPGVTVTPDATGGRDYATNLHDFQPLEVDDVITRLGLSWRANPDLLFYGTISEGYRPPGFNRAAAAGLATADGVPARGNDGPGHHHEGDDHEHVEDFPDYFIPVTYRSDSVQNMELGWKAVLLDRRARFNGSIYSINWDDIQVSHFDSQNISIFTIVDNGGDAEIRGLEVDMAWLATDNLTLYGALSYNDTELVAVNPTFDFVVADVGSQLPLAPELQYNVRGRYEFDIAGGTAHWQLSLKYAGESFNSLVDIPDTDPRKVQDAYSIIDISAGYRSLDGWAAELFIDNFTDERAQLHINRQDFRERVTTNRPMTFGMRVSWEML